MDGTKENAGLSLLKKGQKGIVRLLFSRMGLILALLLVQVLFLLSIFLWFREFLPHIYGGSILFTLVMVLYLLNSSIDPSAKLTWLAVILLLPVFGSLLFLYIQSDVGHRTLKKRHLRQPNRVVCGGRLQEVTQRGGRPGDHAALRSAGCHGEAAESV